MSDQQIDRIAQRVIQQLGRGGAAGSVPSPGAPPIACGEAHRSAPVMTTPGGSAGAYPDVDQAVNATTEAFHRFTALSLSVRDDIIAAIRDSMLANAELLAREAHAETGLGRWQDKVIKNRLVANKSAGTEDLVPQATTGDRGLTLREWAAYGVIASITPSTNPTSTIICNTIGMLAAGNAVVFNVHPMAKRVSLLNIALLNEAITGAGGPPDLVTAVAEPTIESAQALMRHEGVRLLVVTGGPGVVAAAMKSGKRAICAGPGNPPVVVDETADLAQAARDVTRGASFDNNVICTDEKEAFVVASVADKFLEAMKPHGAMVLEAAQTRQIENVVIKERRQPPQSSVVDRDLIGKNAGAILSKAGINAGDDVRLVVLDVDRNHPLVWTEQLMPVFPVVRVANADEGIDLAVAAEGGRRHTAAMHSRNIDKLSRMARLINSSIFVKNGPCYAGLGEGGEGFSSFSIASPTGEGMTGPTSFARPRRCVLVDHFRIV
ncbi:MAG: aldehyde dehydrogenase EutE [bacterium]|nr:aldehyde dehydrogenase EutE [bacterium]